MFMRQASRITDLVASCLTEKRYGAKICTPRALDQVRADQAVFCFVLPGLIAVHLGLQAFFLRTIPCPSP